MKSYKLDQIALISAITQEMNKQFTGIPADERINTVIKAVNSICDEYGREPVLAEFNIGLNAWLASDDTGLSSRYMASILSGSFTATNNYPRDPDDLGRCIRLTISVPEYANLVHLMQASGPHWATVVHNWDHWLELFDAKEFSKLYSDMKEKYAAIKPNRI